MRNTLIAGVLLFVVTIIIQRAYFTDKPEVIYTLSNEIYTSLVESEDREIIQQVTIKNVGALGAERIVITINEYVGRYELRKYSESDSIKVIKTNTKFELIYPSLPPEGQIELLIKNTKNGINKDSLEIKHNSGLGKEAFQKNNSFLLLLLLLAFWMIIVARGAYGLYLDSFQTDIGHDPVNKILKRSKPLFLSSFKWNEFRTEALKNYFYKDRSYTKLNDLVCWQIVSNEKPDHLTNDEWKEVLKEAIKKFKELFTDKIVTSSYLNLSDELFTIERPKQFELTDWKQLLELINNYYIYYSFAHQRSIWSGEFAEKLKRSKPDLVDINIDNKYKAIIREIYFSRFVSQIVRLKSLGSLHYEYDVSLLNGDQQKEIEEISDGLTELKKSKEYRIKLREVIYGRLQDTDKSQIDIEDWEELLNLNKEISKILKDKQQAEEDSVKFSELRERVEKQLSIIDRLISDPDYITKIEDYNDSFNTGNLKNLLKISHALKEKHNAK